MYTKRQAKLSNIVHACVSSFSFRRRPAIFQGLNMKRDIRHIVWDWNGTLLDDVQACVDAINRLLLERSMPEVSADLYRELFEFPVKNYYIKLGFDFDKEDWNELAEKYHAIYANTSSASPIRTGAIPVLDELRSSGIVMTILSACKQSILDQMVSGRSADNWSENRTSPQQEPCLSATRSTILKWPAISAGNVCSSPEATSPRAGSAHADATWSRIFPTC
jgi:hypothetical protein